MKLRVGLVGLLLTLLACGELAGPKARSVALSIVPLFDANGFLAANNADRLRIRVQRDDTGEFVTIKDTTVAIDADGSASADVNVVLVESPQVFRVLLDAVRSSDGAVLFSGSQQVTVRATLGSGPPPAVEIPIAYAGPRGVRVAIAPRDTVVTGGGAFTFRASVFDAGNSAIGVPVGFYLANSADASKLTLNRLTGAATAVAGQQGDVLVYAMSADSLRDTTKVTVGLIPVATVAVTPTPDTVLTGGTVQLTATTRDAASNTLTGRAVTWASSSSNVATVNGSGLVTGVAAGTTTITATSEGKSGTATVVVLVPIASVTVTPGTPVVISGNTVQLAATLRDAGNNVLTGRTVTWSSSASGVASVDGSGLVTSVSPGSVTITATSEGHAGTSTVTVTPLPAGVRVTPGYVDIAVAGNVTLSGAVLDNLGNVIPQLAVTWVSRAPSVASVNASGSVAGGAAGAAVVIASGFGFSDSALVTVPAAGNVIVSATSNGRGFRDVTVGQTAVIDVRADMQIGGGLPLGSYGATITWDPTKLSYVDVQAGDFPYPVVNAAGAATGTLILAQANASGTTGAPILAKLRFQALAAGDAGLTVTITELSAADVPLFTNLFSAGRVTVTNGKVTVH